MNSSSAACKAPKTFALRLAGSDARHCELLQRAPDGIRGRRLVDAHGRSIRDLRLSITDRCNFRCTYCLSENVQFFAKPRLLRADEISRVARLAADLGVSKIRLTGGEPTLHPELVEIVASIRRSCDASIALITNGSLLTPTRLRELRDAGLARITVSIDSLQADRFASITRSRCSPSDVLRVIADSIAAGLTPVKVNAVLLRGVNHDEAADLAGIARTMGVEVRFIEYMPLDSSGGWDPSLWVSAAETRAAIEKRHALREVAADDRASTARLFDFADGAPGRVGFIAPISSPFCGACSRLRITADGMVRPCLFSHDEFDLRSLLRNGASDLELREFLTDAAWSKQAGHGISADGFRQPARTMSAIGG